MAQSGNGGRCEADKFYNQDLRPGKVCFLININGTRDIGRFYQLSSEVYKRKSIPQKTIALQFHNISMQLVTLANRLRI